VLFAGADASLDQFGHLNHSVGLWISDGTAAGTVELGGLGDLGISGAPSSGGLFQFGSVQFPHFIAYKNQVLFEAIDAANKIGLWITDGTTAGTHELTGINNVGAGGLLVNTLDPNFALLNGLVYFRGTNANGVTGLWVTDGTAPGTHQVTEIGGLAPDDLTVVVLGAAVPVANDYLAIARTTLPADQAAAAANAIAAGTLTEAQYVNNLLVSVAATTIPAVAVEASMYGLIGSSAEITKLVTQSLPAPVANAVQFGYNAQVYASEALGLAFAFADENGGQVFSTKYGPSNSAMPNSATGDAAFAAAAASAIFGSAATANTPGAIAGFIANWKTSFTSNGVVGIPNATADQIDLAARGAAWGDAVGIALANNLGPLNGQVINFLDDAAQGTAVYSASLASQPAHAPFQGSAAVAQLVGMGADHAGL
jgi:ELWxxDGT repeat protein